MLALWVFYRLVHAPLQNAPKSSCGAVMVAMQVVEYAEAFRKVIWRNRHASMAGAVLAIYALSSMAWTEWGQYYFCVCPSPISKHLETNAVHLQSLPHLRFPSGHTYFEHGCKRDAVVVHVNSIFRGHAQKQQALRAEGLWTGIDE